ncbi:centromere protein M isoform X1 [Spea bombifrons]|uniref:centromere protein M isoform X1 n=1 Tax=Spea bombifrons TaxID=233779 RepID=UPI0023493D0C|nr:centromere protein M isoform X1 [Spea bombifrons]
MTSLRPFDKLPKLNTAVVLLVGSEEIHREKIANAILKEPKTVNVKIHMTQSLPLPYEREHLRPRFDMVVFLINLRSQFSLSVVLRSLSHLDLNYFLGKVCFLATGCADVKSCMVDISVVKKLADKHLTTLLLCQLDNEEDVACSAQRILHNLEICAGLVPGVSALYLTPLISNCLAFDQS